MRSKKLMQSYKSIRYWLRGYQAWFWNHGYALLNTPEQRQILYEAEALVLEAQKKIDSVFGPEVGKAMLSEAE